MLPLIELKANESEPNENQRQKEDPDPPAIYEIQKDIKLLKANLQA
jgi:hypothetical protein